MCLCFLNWPPFFWWKKRLCISWILSGFLPEPSKTGEIRSSCCLEPWENGDNNWLRTCQNPRIQMKIKKNAWKNIFVYAMFMNMLWICYDVLMNSTWLPARNFKNWSISFCWFEPWKNGENHGFWYILHHLGASVIQTFAEHLTCQHPKCLGKGVLNAFYEFHVPVALHMK